MKEIPERHGETDGRRTVA